MRQWLHRMPKAFQSVRELIFVNAKERSFCVPRFPVSSRLPMTLYDIRDRSRHWLHVVVAMSAWSASPSLGAQQPSTPSGVTRPDSVRRVRDDYTHLPRGRRFYHARPYGSEAQFNPLTEFLNEGYDMLRVEGYDRHVFRWNYAGGAGNIISSLVHADRTYRFYGYQRALQNEILPLTYSDNGTGGQGWETKYSLHLLGSGMVSARMVEWGEQHGVPHPVLLAAVTMAASHLMNEILENGTSRVPNEDATTDFLIFNPGGFLLFQTDVVQRLFSDHVEFTNWPRQPAYMPMSQTLENTGQEFVMRGGLFKAKRWRWLTAFGLSTLFGVSHDQGNGYAISAAIGEDDVANPVADARTTARTATLRPKESLFIDREGSLLASLDVGGTPHDVLASANVYPGAFAGMPWLPGTWVEYLRGGGVRFGVVSRLGLGLGLGPRY